MNIYDLRKGLERKKGQRDEILSELKAVKEEIIKFKIEIRVSEKAQAIIQIVAKKTQKELEYRISEPVTLCLKSVFDNPYEFLVDFVTRRNKSECDLLFKRSSLSKPIIPKDSSGIGAVDVAAFGLRVATWALSRFRSKNVLILDEPFSHLKGIEANKRIIQVVKVLSKQLGLQVIMVSDERVPINEIKKGADRVFEVGIGKNGFSEVKVR